MVTLNNQALGMLVQRSGELIKAGQYDLIAELLREAQLSTSQMGNASLATMLAAGSQISRACHECQAEKEMHQRAYGELGQRMHELARLLQALLNAITGRESPETAIQSDVASELSIPNLLRFEPNLQEVREALTLAPSIQSSRGHGSRPRTSDPGALAITAIPLPHTSTVTQEEDTSPSLMVYCLGPLRVYQDRKLITNWASGKGKAIFRYIVANRGQPASRDILMDMFWPDADVEAARNNLNVAIYGLRQTFRGLRPDFSHILLQEDHYILNPVMHAWIDIEELVRHYDGGQSLERQGMLAVAVQEYEAAESLYQGDFLEEDLYEEWPIIWRENLKEIYVVILDRLSSYYLEQKRYKTCIQVCQKILAKDDCREDIHRRLMRCYSRQDRRNLALRQYDLCVKNLAQTFDSAPIQETMALYQRIRNRESI